MASITIRNLDEDLKAQLRVRAAQNGRSMEEEVRVILRQALARPAGKPGGFGERGAPAFRTKSLADLIREDFAEVGGVDLELPSREEMDREPPDFTGPEYGTYEDDPPIKGKK